MDANGSIFDAINDLAGHVSLFDHAMEYAAEYAVFAIALIVAGSWFLRIGTGESRRVAVYTSVVSAAIALVIALSIQHVYVHPRPFVLRTDVHLLVSHSADPSFPSEHATAAFAMAAGLGLYRQRLGAALLVLAVLTAFSRVYVGLHYPADVAAGGALGIVVAIAVRFAQPVLAWLDRQVVRRLVPSTLL